MIYFKELGITPDNKQLIIDVGIEQLEKFQNVVIDSIYIDTQDTFIQSGPSDKSLKVYSQPEHSTVEVYTCPCIKNVYERDTDAKIYVEDMYDRQNVRLELTKPIIDFKKNNLYFVWVKADTMMAPELQSTCSCGSDTLLGTVLNKHIFYDTLMPSVREIEDTCSIPKNFIDNFLRINAIESSIKAGNYPLAIKYWNRFFNKKNHCCVKPKPCGCHGGH